MRQETRHGTEDCGNNDSNMREDALDRLHLSGVAHAGAGVRVKQAGL